MERFILIETKLNINNVMIKPSKLTEKELKRLQDFQQNSEVLIAQLGQLSFQKLQLEKNENVLKQQYEELIKEETQISTLLKDQYGDVSIDIKTGDITYP
jgi:phage shock protein A